MKNSSIGLAIGAAILFTTGLGLGVVLQQQFSPLAPKQVTVGYSAHSVDKLLVSAFEFGFTNALISCRNGELTGPNPNPEKVREQCLENYMAIMRQGQ